MSRRLAQTIEILLRIPLPPGVKPNQALASVRAALEQSNLPTKQITARIVKRETQYF
jgi:hypothetical protein